MSRRPIAQGITTTQDVVWAFRVLFCREPVHDKIDGIRRRERSLFELRHRMLNSPDFNSDKQRHRCNKPLEAEQVRWCYRLLRFEEIDDDEARRIAEAYPTLIALLDEMLDDDDDALLEAASPCNREEVKRLYAKSMPRSGHHLLTNMLLEYFDAALRYCEFYGGGERCCHSMPCQRAYHPLLGNRWMLQKSHDFQFDDPTDLPGHYIIQYRHPIPRMQSNFDHNVHVTGHEDSLKRFRKFVEAETHYFIRFYDKWMRAPKEAYFLLAYEDIIDAPRAAFTQLLRFIGEDDIQDKAIGRALAIMRTPSPSSHQRSSEFALRQVSEYRYYDEGLYRAVEEEIFGACTELRLKRMFA